MYELFESNEQDESLLLVGEDMVSLNEAMESLKEYDSHHCQIEKFDIPENLKNTAEMLKKRNYWDYVRFMGIYGRYTLIATKHNGEIKKFY